MQTKQLLPYLNRGVQTFWNLPQYRLLSFVVHITFLFIIFIDMKPLALCKRKRFA